MLIKSEITDSLTPLISSTIVVRISSYFVGLFLFFKPAKTHHFSDLLLIYGVAIKQGRPFGSKVGQSKMTPDNFILLGGPGFDSLGHILWVELIN